MMTHANNSYGDQLNHNITVWLKRTKDLAEGKTKGYYKKFPNLLRLITQALASPQTRSPNVAHLVKQAYWIPNEYGRWPTWQPHIQECLSLFEDEYHPIYIELLIQQGKCFSRTHQMNQAIECHQKAKTLAEHTDHQKLLTEALYNLCFNFRAQNSYQKAMDYGGQALELALLAHQDNDQLLLHIINEIGRIHFDIGDQKNLRIAKKKFEEALTYCQMDVASPMHFKIMVNLGITMMGLKEYDEASSIYASGQAILNEVSNELDKCRFWSAYGVLYFNMGNYQEAEMAFQMANNKYLAESGDIFFHAQIKQNLGNVLTKQNRYQEAESYLWQAIRLLEQINTKLWLANTHGTLGELLFKKNELASSLNQYTKAIEILKRLPESPHATRLLKEFSEEQAEVLKVLGGKKKENQ
jgi:tetratricopeptide (TPR) repeat protein